MRYRFLLTAFVVIVTAIAPNNGCIRCEEHSGSALPESTIQEIETVVSELQKQSGAPGVSIAVAAENQVCYAAGFGLADVENNVSVTPDSRFRTASVAKPMTAVLILRMVQDGRLDLDADVRTYCPAYPEKQWVMSSRQLLAHLGGVRHYRNSAEAASTERFQSLSHALSVFADDPLLHEPGSKYVYSTFGYNLLGSVAEGASGDSFLSLLEDRVLRPAEMKMTVADDHARIVPGRVRGYSRPAAGLLSKLMPDSDSEWGTLRNAALHDTSMKIPGGGLLSTAADLVRFAVAVNTGRLLNEELRQLMWTEQRAADGKRTGYGLGWGIGRLDRHRVVSHSGGQAGTSTILVLIPETGTAVAVMCNQQGVSLTDTARRIAGLVPVPASAANPAQSQRTRSEESSSEPPDYSAAVEQLNIAIQYEVEQKQIPAFSIALADDNRIIHADGFGFQDAARTIPATGDTVYRVGSVSKLFTDIAVMQLVEEGQLRLDAPVQDYLPAFRPNNPFAVDITLRRLMSHQSGLVRESPAGSYFDPSEPTLKATVESLNQTTLAVKPNTRTKYSNAAVAVVGAVLESRLNTSHPERVRQSILNPLEMNLSSFVISPEIRPHLATGWMWTYDGRRFEAPTFLLGTGPAGNMYSSMTDLAGFLSCLFRNSRILSPESWQMMLTPVQDGDGNPQPFGLGFHIQSLDGHRKIGHGGAVYGFSTQLEALPERKLGVAASASLDGSNGVVRRLADYALRLMLAVQDDRPLPKYQTTTSIPADRIGDLAGDFEEIDGPGRACITELGGNVFLKRGVYRYALRARTEDGAMVTDDVTGFGTTVELTDHDHLLIDGKRFHRLPDTAPAGIPERWQGLIGEYGWDHNTLYILEDHGQLWALIEWFFYYPLTEVDENTFRFPDYGLYHDEGLQFTRGPDGIATEVNAAEVRFVRRESGTKDGETFRITPLRPVDELREEALAASPPPESGDFLATDLTEIITLDPTVRLDIRYASTNNFTGSVFYRQPRAFLQRPAAEAVVRIHRRLADEGLGLLIHDAYRPWHVTKMFWEATPPSLRDFVANPANGSRHNRGCAVDLTLFDLASGQPIPMVAGYDEFSARSFPLYPGGTSRQRWYRDRLRRAMQSEGFSVYEFEWWHFDYADWKKYKIGNQTFEELSD